MTNCDVCGKNFVNKYTYLRHFQEVHNVKDKAKCSECEKTFLRPSDLKRHEKVHGVVGQRGGEICSDDHGLCRFWASMGECPKNAFWMQSHCRLSCRLCFPKPEKLHIPGLSLPQEVLDNLAKSFQPEPQLQQLRPMPSRAESVLGPQTLGKRPEPAGSDFFQRNKFPKRPEPTPLKPEQPTFSQRQRQTSFTKFGSSQNHSGGRPPTRRGNLQLCAGLFRQPPANLSALVQQQGLNVPFENTEFRQLLSFDDVVMSNDNRGCAPSLTGNPNCFQNDCYNLVYRTMDGTCNNPEHPLWGAAFTPLLLNLPPFYTDGIGDPVENRPTAREISLFLLRSEGLVVEETSNAMLMQFGQFMAHDMTKTSLLRSDQCTSCHDTSGRCMKIPVTPFDESAQRFGCDGDVCCIKGPRSSPLCGTGQSTPRQQLNENTAFIDGSMIYGSSALDLGKFRDGNSGFLRLSFFENRPFMPFNMEECPNLGPHCKAEFHAGDARANVFVGLTAMHTLFVREHNRVASILQPMNPHWDGDRLFQETRKIIGAELQTLTYNHWLPRILGAQEYEVRIGAYRAYSISTNPSMSAEFSGGAFRFGHGMINEFFPRVTADGQRVGSFHFPDGLLHSEMVLHESEMDLIIRGLMLTPVKSPQRLSISPTDQLFGKADLAALNLQRGREMGLPGYNAWRKFCKMPLARTFQDFQDAIKDPAVIEAVASMHTSPDDVDLYVGVLLEDPIPGGLVGPITACLLGAQFRRVRDGDRFWYENPSVFTPAQMEALNRTSLSRIFCDNADNFLSAPTNAFDFTGKISSFTPCQNIPVFNLEPWREL